MGYIEKRFPAVSMLAAHEAIKSGCSSDREGSSRGDQKKKKKEWAPEKGIMSAA